jgi:hypothetical protein
MINHEQARTLLLSFPGVSEAPCYGTPGFRLREKLLARFHEDRASLVLAVEEDTRDFLIKHCPKVFYVTDHYVGYPYVLARMSAVKEADLRDLVEAMWRQHAPKQLIAQYDQSNSNRK